MAIWFQEALAAARADAEKIQRSKGSNNSALVRIRKNMMVSAKAGKAVRQMAQELRGG